MRPFLIVLVALDLRRLAPTEGDQGLSGAMPVWLRPLGRVDVENPDAQALVLHDDVERVAVDYVCHAAV